MQIIYAVVKTVYLNCLFSYDSMMLSSIIKFIYVLCVLNFFEHTSII